MRCLFISSSLREYDSTAFFELEKIVKPNTELDIANINNRISFVFGSSNKIEIIRKNIPVIMKKYPEKRAIFCFLTNRFFIFAGSGLILNLYGRFVITDGISCEIIILTSE